MDRINSETSVPPIRVLVVSHACIRSANREVYRRLHKMGYDVTLLIAANVTVQNGETHEAEAAGIDDPPTIISKTSGRNLRLLQFSGLMSALKAFNPNIVFVEADPVSALAVRSALWCRIHGAKLICRTCENLHWRPDKAVKRAGLRELPVSTVKWIAHKFMSRAVAAVCVTSDEAQQVFSDSGYRTALNVPMGIDEDQFRYRSARRRETPVR